MYPKERPCEWYAAVLRKRVMWGPHVYCPYASVPSYCSSTLRGWHCHHPGGQHDLSRDRRSNGRTRFAAKTSIRSRGGTGVVHAYLRLGVETLELV